MKEPMFMVYGKEGEGRSRVVNSRPFTSEEEAAKARKNVKDGKDLVQWTERYTKMHEMNKKKEYLTEMDKVNQELADKDCSFRNDSATWLKFMKEYVESEIKVDYSQSKPTPRDLHWQQILRETLNKHFEMKKEEKKMLPQRFDTPSENLDVRAKITYTNGSHATVRQVHHAFYDGSSEIDMVSHFIDKRNLGNGNFKNSVKVDRYTLNAVDVRSIKFVTSENGIVQKVDVWAIHSNTIVDVDTSTKKNKVRNPNYTNTVSGEEKKKRAAEKRTKRIQQRKEKQSPESKSE